MKILQKSKILFILCLIVGLQSNVHAGNGTWKGASGADWSTPGNWTGSVPGATSGTINTDTATFSAPAGTINVADSSTYRNLAEISFSGSSNSNYKIGSSSDTIYFTYNGGNPNIALTSSVTTPGATEPQLTIASNLMATSANGTTGNDIRIYDQSGASQLNLTGNISTVAASGISDLRILTNSGSTIVISGNITDGTNAKMAVSSAFPGLLLLSGVNTYSGGFIQGNGGSLPTTQIGTNSVLAGGVLASSVFGTGTITWIDGTISSNGTTARTIYNNVTFSNNFNKILGDATNSGLLTFAGNGALVSSGTTTLQTNSNAIWTGTLTGTSKLLTKSGTADLTLSNSTGNTYTGATTITAGRLFANNVTGSATGTGTVTVASTGTLGGSGRVTGTVMVQSGGNLASGAAQGTGYAGTANNNGKVNQTGTGGGLTLTSTLNINAGASLTFALGTGSSTGSSYATPNTNSTYLTVGGTGSVVFGTGSQITIDLYDLAATSPTNDSLQLRYQSPYLLMNSSTGTNLAYNLYTTGGFDGNGIVLGIIANTTGLSQGQMLTSSQLSADGFESNAFLYQVIDPSTGSHIAGTQNYYNLKLYLDNGQLEVVPEPGTWALMMGGLALLIFVQRRRNKSGGL